MCWPRRVFATVIGVCRCSCAAKDMAGKHLVYRLYSEESSQLRSKSPRRWKMVVARRERYFAKRQNQAWSMDFVSDQLVNGQRTTDTCLDCSGCIHARSARRHRRQELTCGSRRRCVQSLGSPARCAGACLRRRRQRVLREAARSLGVPPQGQPRLQSSGADQFAGATELINRPASVGSASTDGVSPRNSPVWRATRCLCRLLWWSLKNSYRTMGCSQTGPEIPRLATSTLINEWLQSIDFRDIDHSENLQRFRFPRHHIN